MKTRFLQSPPRWAKWILLAVVVWGSELAWLIHEGFAARRAEQRLADRTREWQRALAVAPASTVANADLIEADRARVTAELRGWQMKFSWPGETVTGWPVPGSSAEMYFELMDMNRRLRARAGEMGVRLQADERFGFAEFAQAGPSTADLPRIARERAVADAVLDRLLRAQPHELVAVRRERPGEAAGRGSGRETGKDHFEASSAASARLPDHVQSTVLQVTFVGRTAVLSDWLNQLATAELPLVVQAIEAAPVDAVSPETARRGAAASELVLPPTLTRFVVTVACYRIRSPEPAPGSQA